MSKKNKIQKQLLRAQIERNAQALASGKTIEQVKPVSIPSTPESSVTSSNAPVATPASPKEVSEVAMIRKDTRLSLILTAIVFVCIIAIYLVDKSNPFLLNLANTIFETLLK